MKPSKEQHLGLKKQRSFNRCVFAVVLAACLCQQCYANPIAMDFDSMMIGTEGNLGIMRHVVQVVRVDFVIDLCVLVVGFIMIRRAHHLKTWKFIIYLPIVVIGGLAIDELSPHLGHALMLSPLLRFLLTFTLLFAFNFILCLILFRFPIREAGLIAVLMGLLTHPGVYAELSAFFVFGILFLLLFGSYMQRACNPEAEPSDPQECNHDIPLVQVKVDKTEPRCPAVEVGKIVLELSRLASNPESEEARKEIIQLGRKLDTLPRISLNSNLVYAFRTILEFLGEKDAQKVAHVWEENGWNVRKWMSEDLYIL
jgi:hypothetical protein